MLTAYLYTDEECGSLLQRIHSSQNLDETIQLIERDIANHLPQVRSYQIENTEGDILAVGVPSRA